MTVKPHVNISSPLFLLSEIFLLWPAALGYTTYRQGTVQPFWGSPSGAVGNSERPTSNFRRRIRLPEIFCSRLEVERWTFAFAFLPTYRSLPAFTCLYRYHTRLSLALSCHPYSVVKRFDSVPFNKLRASNLKRSGRQAPQRARGGGPYRRA